MAYSAMQVANAFIKKAKDGKIAGLTPMKLQKLMFFAQSWYLRMYRTRLINDEFVRWKHGPVIQSVYYEFASNGGNVIKDFAKNSLGQDVAFELNQFDDQFLDRIIATYGAFSGWQLSEMTHTEKGAWMMNNNIPGSLITDGEMSDGEV